MAGGFMANTRQNQRFNLSKACPTGAGPVEWQLPPVGLLSRLMLSIKGTINGVNAGGGTLTVAPASPWLHIQRIRVFANGGITFVDLSGYDLYLENLTRTFGAMFDVYSANAPDVYTLENAKAAAPGTTNDVAYTLVLPIALNDRDGIGLFLLQNPTTQVTVRIDFNDPTADGVLYDLGAGDSLTTPVFNAHLSVEHFSIPPDDADFPTINTVVATISQKLDISSAGIAEHQALLGNIWTKIIYYYASDAMLTPVAMSAIQDFQLVYNQTEVPYYLRPETVRRDMLDMYGRDFPGGVYALDFNHQGLPQTGTSRDWINTGAITDLRLKTNIGAAGVPCSLYVVTQQIINLDDK